MSVSPPSTGQYSPDGRWWWDGTRWVAVGALVSAAPVAAVPVAYTQGPRTNGAAVASLIVGILSWLLCPIIGAVVAVVLGHVARGQIRRTGEGGSGVAMAGLILGYAHLAVYGAILVLWLVLLGGMAAMLGVIATTPLASPSP